MKKSMRLASLFALIGTLVVVFLLRNTEKAPLRKIASAKAPIALPKDEAVVSPKEAKVLEVTKVKKILTSSDLGIETSPKMSARAKFREINRSPAHSYYQMMLDGKIVRGYYVSSERTEEAQKYLDHSQAAFPVYSEAKAEEKIRSLIAQDPNCTVDNIQFLGAVWEPVSPTKLEPVLNLHVNYACPPRFRYKRSYWLLSAKDYQFIKEFENRSQ
jgi:hypothetical protein